MIIGMTGSGKSTFARAMMRRYHAAGYVRQVVIDPMGYDWPHAFVFRSPGDGVTHALADGTRNTVVWIDEASLVAANTKSGERTAHLVRTARHRGVEVWLLSQRYVDIAPRVRGNIQRLYLMRTGRKDAAQIAEEWSSDEAEQAPTFRRGEILVMGRLEREKWVYSDPGPNGPILKAYNHRQE